eukprot:CAMPEP_0174727912 /NCGR_PEP_ID=MMETSP1094-20130205/50709_1 /TAXON_ID=156173 /ORGANISM="Chrysochromulina brevifilum, Strain UTEX LB 985" /LENGTH=74 /DNA_ID=CAMNT_0015929749 /DNA_START=292 /DNA_END=517 /DNA_ORIENTATION=+
MAPSIAGGGGGSKGLGGLDGGDGNDGGIGGSAGGSGGGRGAAVRFTFSLGRKVWSASVPQYTAGQDVGFGNLYI